MNLQDYLYEVKTILNNKRSHKNKLNKKEEKRKNTLLLYVDVKKKLIESFYQNPNANFHRIIIDIDVKIIDRSFLYELCHDDGIYFHTEHFLYGIQLNIHKDLSAPDSKIEFILDFRDGYYLKQKKEPSIKYY